jgi:hypothetical protein
MDRDTALETIMRAPAAGQKPSGITASGRLRLVLAIACYLAACVLAVVVVEGPYGSCRLDAQPPTFHVPKGLKLAGTLAALVTLFLLLPAVCLALSAFLGLPLTAGCGGLLHPQSLGCIALAVLALAAAALAAWPLISVVRCGGGHAVTSDGPSTCIWISVGLAAAVATVLAHYAWAR